MTESKKVTAVTSIISSLGRAIEQKPTQFFIALVVVFGLMTGVLAFAIGVGGPDLLKQAMKQGTSELIESLNETNRTLSLLSENLTALQARMQNLEIRLEGLERSTDRFAPFSPRPDQPVEDGDE